MLLSAWGAVRRISNSLGIHFLLVNRTSSSLFVFVTCHHLRNVYHLIDMLPKFGLQHGVEANFVPPWSLAGIDVLLPGLRVKGASDVVRRVVKNAVTSWVSLFEGTTVLCVVAYGWFVSVGGTRGKYSRPISAFDLCVCTLVSDKWCTLNQCTQKELQIMLHA